MEATRVTVDEVKARMDRGEEFAFVDTRNPKAWGEATTKLPGAIRLPAESSNVLIVPSSGPPLAMVRGDRPDPPEVKVPAAERSLPDRRVAVGLDGNAGSAIRQATWDDGAVTSPGSPAATATAAAGEPAATEPG